MEQLEIMQARHSVRQYLDRKIGEDVRKELNTCLAGANAAGGLHMQIFYDEPECFRSLLAHYGKFTNVSNYIAVVGTKQQQEQAGYYGEKLVLKCQELGLNTCWVALTHGKTKAVLGPGEKLLIVIALGYGANQGVRHASKPVSQLSRWDQEEEWFKLGMEAACLAPTAMNQQKFFLELNNGTVTARAGSGFYTRIDLGIVKYHFETVSGHEIR